MMIMATNSPNWFLIIPYYITPNPVHFFGLFFALAGLESMVSGGILGVKYRLGRVQYLDELKELQSMKEFCQTKGNVEPPKIEGD